MQKKDEQKERDELHTLIVNDIRMQLCSDLLDCDRYVIIMQRGDQAITQCSTSRSDARDLISRTEHHYRG